MFGFLFERRWETAAMSGVYRSVYRAGSRLSSHPNLERRAKHHPLRRIPVVPIHPRRSGVGKLSVAEPHRFKQQTVRDNVYTFCQIHRGTQHFAD